VHEIFPESCRSSGYGTDSDNFYVMLSHIKPCRGTFMHVCITHTIRLIGLMRSTGREICDV